MNITSFAFILLFLTSLAKASDINTTYAYYIKAMLEHKDNNQDASSYSCYVANWNEFDSSFLFGDYFKHNQGIMTTSSLFQRSDNYGFHWSLGFTFYDGRYVDEHLANIRLPNLNFPYSIDVTDEANGTLFLSNVSLVSRIQNSSDPFISNLTGNLSIYVVERSTMKPPVSIDKNHLSHYTVQFMFMDHKSTFSFVTPFFNKTYPVSTLDKIIVLIGSLIYGVLSITSRMKTANKRFEVSFAALACLYLYPFYLLSYIVIWFNQQNFLWETLIWFIPFFLAIIADIIMNSVLLVNHRKCSPNYSFGIIFAFLLSFAFVYIPCLGVLAPSFFLLPQILYKFKEKRVNVWYKSITRFEIGNWTCMSMWIVYIKLYPNNILLLSPVPAIVVSFFGVIFLQLLIIAYIKFFVPGKEIFKYTFIEEDPNRISQLLLDQCAICLNNLKNEDGNDDKLYKTPCGHVFHSECLLEWSEKKLLCPCCRKKLPEFIQPIYPIN